MNDTARDEWKRHTAKTLSDTVSMFDRPSLKTRIRLAREHMLRERQQHDTLWPHQQFALTLGELLDAAAAHTESK